MDILTKQATPARGPDPLKTNKRMDELLETGFDLTNVKPMVGGGTPPTLSNWWLEDLPIGTVFLARQKPSSTQMQLSLELTEYGIFNKIEKCTLLLVRQPGSTIPIWVDTKLFSTKVEYLETLRTQDRQIMFMREELKKEEEHVDNRDDTGSVRSSGLPDDAGHQV